MANLSVSADQLEILVKIGGQIDAVFLPVRRHSEHRWCNAYALRAHVAGGGGIAWRGAGDQATSRNLSHLAAQGLLTRHKTAAGSKTVSVTLTDVGDRLARHCCRDRGPDNSLSLMRQIQRLAGKTPWEYRADGKSPIWGTLRRVSESTLTRTLCTDPKFQTEALRLEDAALPALVRGWLVSAATTMGAVWYEVTAAGRAALKAGEKQPAGFPAVSQEESDRLGQLRDSALAEQVAALNVDIGTREIGEIPLCASGEPFTWATRANGD